MKYTIETLVCGAYQVNAYLLCPEGSRDAVLIDPGDDIARLKKAIAEKGRMLKGILLTHGHFDHMLSAQPLSALTGAPVYVHAQDQELLLDAGKASYSADVCYQSFPVDFEADFLEERICIAGMEFEVLHTPGHTRGSVCFYDAENAVLFSGDTLFCAGFGRMDLYGGSPAQMRESLRALFDLPGGTRVLCGHGYETTIGAEKGRYRL